MARSRASGGTFTRPAQQVPEPVPNPVSAAEAAAEAEVVPEPVSNPVSTAEAEVVPGQALEEVHHARVARPARSTRAVKSARPTRWQVSLPRCPTLVVEADSEESAKVAYMKAQSLVSTDHVFEVIPLED